LWIDSCWIDQSRVVTKDYAKTRDQYGIAAGGNVKKNHRWLLGSVVICLGLFLSQAQAATQFKIATLSPDGSTWMKKLHEGADEVKKKTNGRVKFKFYPGGVMGQDKAVLRKMRIGQLQGGAFTNGTLAATYPGVQIYNLIMEFNSFDEVDYVRKRMDPIIQKGLEDNGLVALGLSEIGFAYIMSTEPIATVNDLRKQKAWIPENNFVADQALKAFSVTPIPLPLRDVLVALQTGMVNTVAASPIGAITLQWHTKVKYVTDLPVAYIYGILAVNKSTFNKLSPGDQTIVRDVMGRISTELDGLNRKDNLAALDALHKQGLKFIEPKPAAVAELKRLVSSANKNLITSGEVNPKLVETMEQYLQEFRAQHTHAHE
jgi:TRAP-type C4-dicarboxylate transport system substrate-binding protein